NTEAFKSDAMNQPKTVDHLPVAPDSTSDYLNQPAPPPSKEFKIALVGSSGLDPTREIQTLLRRRLGVVALLATVALTQYLISWLFRPPSVFDVGLSATVIARPWIAWQFVVDTLAASLAGLLWSRRALSLRQLRLIELFLVGLVFAHLSGDLWFLAVHLGWV